MAADHTSTEIAIAAFSNIVSSCNVLTDARGQYFLHEGPPILVAVELSFGNESILVTAMEDDSLVVVSNKTFQDVNQHVLKPLEHDPWKGAFGRPLLWAWVMVNQQGYFDGVQLDFSESSESTVFRIQVLCVASELKIQP